MSNVLPHQILITALITVWAVRLIAYVYRRYDGKDPRFATWKWQGMKTLIINIIWVFGQLLMIAVMSYPSLLINTYNTPHGISLLELCGLAVWLCGFYWETVSDNQLFTFRHNPAHKGHVMSSGLWRYSRHPNYFGESVMWHGVFLIALCTPCGWTALIAPATITFFLLCITGVPLLEKAMEHNAEYQEYKRKTSMFIPMPPKK
jgi:steroid 5-alpha reductase family enzyme